MAASRIPKPWNRVFGLTITANTLNSNSPCFVSIQRSRSNSSIAKSNETLPVLIIGAGPVGLVLSFLLTKLGVKCAVLEKNMTFSQHPQAHFINNRTMEIFRKLDGLAEEINGLQPPMDLWRKFIYCTSLSGPVLGSVDHMQPQDFEKVASPVSVAHFSQYKLVRLLVKRLADLNFQVCTTDTIEGQDCAVLGGNKIMMGHECTYISPTADGVEVGVSFIREGKRMEKKICCRILVGSDGAGSTVRKLVGIKMEGERDLQKLISVHFLSKDLGDYLLHQMPGMLFFIFNSEAIGVLVAHDLNKGEFILQVPFYPPQQSLEDFTPKVCREIIFMLVGHKLVDVDVIGIKPWIMHAEVAEKFVSSCDHVILAGDAAHRFPPAGGFGVASPSILQTYETERRPIAKFNTALSVANYKAAMSIPSTLGLDPTMANTVHRVVNSGLGSIMPPRLQKLFLEGIFSIGRAQLSPFLLNEANPFGSARLAKLKSILDEGNSLQLQFPAEDLGFRYLEGALVPEITVCGEETFEPTGRRREYVPSAETGKRLPHMNVRVLKGVSKKEILSTLDLLFGDKIDFLLIVGPRKESYHLASGAINVARSYEVSLRVCIMWPYGSTHECMAANDAIRPQVENVIDVVELGCPLSSSSVLSSSSSSWWDLCKMSNKGAILVRPDEHIAWRTKFGIDGDVDGEIRRVFSMILGVNK
ncbi:hypothetical protein AMTR_s00049p00109360 [Amborella trichopoda]|uniref:FAD-binding domain-containing protein n=1 Tax=Amborella trichopoda TaxID=13333 RepID=W1PZQ8_AMBTC|nr:hypothetical protein AMTR_s00049p00109360 [Amborella trichopoda]